MKCRTRSEYRRRRHLRIRQKIRGTADRPRMCVHVSNRHLRVQFIDDDRGHVLAACSTLTPALRERLKGRHDVAAARELGAEAARIALARGITTVVFDRGGFAFKGRVKALADAAREAGLKF